MYENTSATRFLLIVFECLDVPVGDSLSLFMTSQMSWNQTTILHA